MKIRLTCLLLLLGVLPAFAQKKSKSTAKVSAPVVPKKVLSADSYDGWKTIPDRQLSPDGRWAGYVLNPQEGDGRLVLQSLTTPKLDSVPRGYDLRMSADNQYAVFKIKPQFAVSKEARRAKKKRDELPKDSLGLYALATGTLTKVPNALTYRIPEKAGAFVAYQLDPGVVKVGAARQDSTKKVPDPRKPVPTKDAATAAPDTVRPTRSATTKSKTPRRENDDNGYRLVVKNLKTGAERTFAYVTEYEFSKNGNRLAFATTGNDSTMKLPGVYVYEPERGTLTKVYEAKGKAKRPTFDEAGDQLAFVVDADTNAKSLIRYPKLYYWKAGAPRAEPLVSEENQPGPKGWLVSADAPIRFAKNGSKLFFGTAPKPVVADTSRLPEEIVNVEVWNWQDRRLQTQQKVSLERDKKRAYSAVVNLADRKLVQLATPEVPLTTWADEGNADFVLATSNERYSNQHWDWSNFVDAYLVSTRDGSRTNVAEKVKTGGGFAGGGMGLSPGGKYVTWFSLPDTTWFFYAVATGKTTKLRPFTRFADEDDDHPDYPDAYGAAGWLPNDSLWLVYDKFDVWAVNPTDPANPVQFTKGRSEKKEYRLARLDTGEDVPRNLPLNPKNPVLLRTFDHRTKGSGYAQLTTDNLKLTTLLTGDFSVSPLVWKARDAEQYLFTKQTFREYPDLHATDGTFKTVRKLSDANPQQREYRWGTAELVKWQAGDGTPLEGLLFKPDDFDPTKQYPMMVYFYEKNAENLHTHVAPIPVSTNNNYTYYTSNGYLVFVPDIVYQVGYPGKSAYNCVVPGVLKLIEQGFVAKDRIGISGHSWGGYQTAYLITQTNLFRAAEAGAPVANMTSAYGGIRWESGMSRQAQYERTQTRIGGTLWEKPQEYVVNSPLFFAPNVQTPLLMMHNDDDGAVPWYQGIEYFMALKRLNKPVWLLNYNGEKHGLTQRKNRKDFSRRMYQFFDHYLKGAPAPDWMTNGLPMLEKGINQHLEVGK
jgi:dipeptidyl aminopeptidase/acylaminoacyl peptidase